MQNSYTNKIVLVTGGTSGIGKATALAFAEAGAKVVITGRREKEGADVAAEITKKGGTAAFVRADVAKDADVVKAIDFVVSTMAVSMSPSTMAASKSPVRSIKSPKNNMRREQCVTAVLRFQLWSGPGPCADLPESHNLAARRYHSLSQSALKGLDSH
jgi:NAD(P)-dependent dehydrogenase (short-subunit alcohol dehydrogenase family)